MNWMEETAFVAKVGPAAVELRVTRPSSDGCGSCAGCRICTEKQGAAAYRIAVPENSGYSPGQVVRIRHAVPPFGLSVFLLFILPLILMAGFPLLLSVLAGELAEKPVFITLAVFLGLLLAFAINYGVDRKIQKKYPASIIKQ